MLNFASWPLVQGMLSQTSKLHATAILHASETHFAPSCSAWLSPSLFWYKLAFDIGTSLLTLWHQRGVSAGLQWRWRGQHGSSQSLPAPSVNEANCRYVLVVYLRMTSVCPKLACNAALPAGEMLHNSQNALVVRLCSVQE